MDRSALKLLHVFFWIFLVEVRCTPCAVETTDFRRELLSEDANASPVPTALGTTAAPTSTATPTDLNSTFDTPTPTLHVLSPPPPRPRSPPPPPPPPPPERNKVISAITVFGLSAMALLLVFAYIYSGRTTEPFDHAKEAQRQAEEAASAAEGQEEGHVEVAGRLETAKSLCKWRSPQDIVATMDIGVGTEDFESADVGAVPDRPEGRSNKSFSISNLWASYKVPDEPCPTGHIYTNPLST